MSLRRFRLLLPPSSYLVLYVAMYLLANLPVMIAAGNGGGPLPDRASYGRTAVLVFGLIAYGAYRAFAFHPLFRAGYRKWLETTPWDWRKPLPVGPVRPVWEDVAIVSAMSAPAWYFGELAPPFGSFALALGGYLMALGLSFGATGAWGFQYAVWFVVGLAVRVWDGPSWGYFGAILLGLALGLVGLGRSLKRWPWPATFDFDPNRVESLMNNPQAAQGHDLGWPFDRLGPRRDAAAPGWRNSLSALLSSLLAGWWLYAVLALTGNANARMALGFMALIYGTLFATIFRMSRYLTGYASPLDLGGRLARFRPILPSYDQVFVAPLVAVMTATSVPMLLDRAGLPTDAAIAIAFALTFAALSLGGPDRARWQITARHRIVPAIGSSAKQKGGFVQVG